MEWEKLLRTSILKSWLSVETLADTLAIYNELNSNLSIKG